MQDALIFLVSTQMYHSEGITLQSHWVLALRTLREVSLPTRL